MTTILYFHDTDAQEPMPNVKQSSTNITHWYSDSSSGITPKLMNTTIGASKKNISGTFAEAGAAHYGWTKAFISPPLSGNQTISGTVTIILDHVESNAAKNSFPRVYIYVWKGDDSGIRGVLLADTNSGTEAGTSESDVTYFNTVSLSSVNALDGDRIVIELMQYHNNTKTTSYTDTFYYDSAAAPGVSRAEFSANLTFQTIIKQWSQTGNVAHMLLRHKFFNLTQTLQILGSWTLPFALKKWTAALQTTHIFRQPYRSLKLTQALNLTHVFHRPFRYFKFTQTVKAAHYLHINKFVKFITQTLNLLYSWITQTFTEIFSDGFESGDFSAWDGTAVSGGCSVTVVTENPHHGSYNQKAVVTGSGTDIHAYSYKNIGTSYAHAFARAYVKYVSYSGLDADEIIPTIGFWVSATATNTARTGLGKDPSGNVRWGLRYYNAGTFYNAFGSSTPSTGVYYCLELEVQVGTSGYCKVYVNGQLEIEVTGINNSARQFSHVHSGVDNVAGTAGATVYVDCVVVADAYIGLEGVIKQWSQTGITSHVLSRHKTFKLTNNLNTIHIFLRHKTFKLTNNLNTIHAFRRPYRTMKITQILSLTHVFRRPFCLMKLTQILSLTHTFTRPFRLIKLTQNLSLSHVLHINKLVKFITQILNPLHSWIKRALGGFPFKIEVEERKQIQFEFEEGELIQIEVEECKPIQIEVEERKPIQIGVEESKPIQIEVEER